MKKIFSILLILVLTECSSVGKFGAGVDITFDPRTIGMQIDDKIMEKTSLQDWLCIIKNIFYQYNLK